MNNLYSYLVHNGYIKTRSNGSLVKMYEEPRQQAINEFVDLHVSKKWMNAKLRRQVMQVSSAKDVLLNRIDRFKK